MTVRSGNHNNPAWGVNGGQRPQPSKTTIQPPGEEITETNILERRSVTAGSRLTLYQGGGGGYGDPKERPRKLVLADIRDGYISRERAIDIYGINDFEKTD